MIKQIFQNIIAPKTAVSANNFGRNFNVTGVSEGIFTRMFYQLRKRGHALIEKWQREYEIEESIIHLRSLTNEQLSDMGITRDDIPHVVRYGKDAI